LEIVKSCSEAALNFLGKNAFGLIQEYCTKTQPILSKTAELNQAKEAGWQKTCPEPVEGFLPPNPLPFCLPLDGASPPKLSDGRLPARLAVAPAKRAGRQGFFGTCAYFGHSI